MFITFSSFGLTILSGETLVAGGVLTAFSWSQWLGPAVNVLFAGLLVVSCLAAWAANLVALPGNWVAVLLLAIYAWLMPDQGVIGLGATAVLIAFGFALLGEILEFVAGAIGASRAGASRRSTIYAIIGSMVGAMLGAAIGIPIPIVGSVLAAILFGGIGATAGAMYGEWTNGRPWRESWAIGQAAFWGRTTGTVAKMGAGLGVVAVACVGIFV